MSQPSSSPNSGIDVEKRAQLQDMSLGKIISKSAPEEVVAKDADENEMVVEKMRMEESGHDIKYKTMSWQRTAALLFAEYICLAILSFAWSFAYLGYVPALILNFVMGFLAWYTSYVLWQYCMKYPAVKDICDIGYLVFGNSKLARELTALGLCLNNIFIMGLHVLTGSQVLNTDSDHSMCTTGFVFIVLIISIICSMPRTLTHVSYMGIVSAIFMAMSVLLTMIFAGIQDHPSHGPGGKEYPSLGPVTSKAWTPSTTTFITGNNALLNMTFTWIGHICYPSFIAEMKEPKDFPKALALLSVAELIVFSLFGVVGYRYLGQYATAPAVGALIPKYKKIAFTFALVPTVVIGTIYANVVVKYLYFRILGNSRHAHSHTVIGWGVWIATVAVTWTLGMIVAEVIPSFGDLLSLMSALFDSFFGYIFWALAYYELNRDQLWNGPKKIFLTIANIFIFCVGMYMLGPGTYTSVEAIIESYKGDIAKPFTCTDNSL